MVLNRRGFLGAVGAAAAAGLASSSSGLTDLVLADGGRGAAGEQLRELPFLRSEGGLLDVGLTIHPQRLQIGDREVFVHTYNGMLPGPGLRFRPGDKLRINLINNMLPLGVPLNAPPPACAVRPPEEEDAPPLEPPPHPLECIPEMINHIAEGETVIQMNMTTNIHTHGLQVSPNDPADNIFLKLSPGHSHQYEYEIPDDHPAGLFWYHPHHHGSTTHQSWEGLTAPMIVEGDIDEVPELADIADRTIVLSTLWINQDGSTPSAVIIPTGGQMPFTTVPAVPTEMLFLMNGQLGPEIDIRPGETQRWRVLNSDPHEFMWFEVKDHELYQIGQDGIPFGTPRTVRSIMLPPANRAELVIRGGQPGRYRVIGKAYDQGHPGGARPEKELGTLVVAGPPANGRIPQRLVEPPKMPDLPVAAHREFRFKGDISGRRGLGVRFWIDGVAFDPDRIDTRVRAGTVEEWTWINEDIFQHPIHVHVNPFQVIDVQGISEGDTSWQTDPNIWWDTFRLPPFGRVTIRTYFRPDIPGRNVYPSKTVYHCHILHHEDNGMMGVLLIDPPEGRS
ncbi:hypothetical protein GCM10012275_37040 [Longimycelium tulufanense]|uniref:Uncharacterized protein n=1 Tax=Longimycelium tulufanense TaxID=907463 RepID=A0A8J3FUX3_9PSEU|nr:multicopper oxidase domain-containing protein [Longimycelium tulufanense]GGM62944.1 hypothetical protein GCM10012275_37040 [Longimycelium tulufanense]